MVVHIGDRKVSNAYWAGLTRDEQEAFREEARRERELKQAEEDARAIANAVMNPLDPAERERLRAGFARVLEEVTESLPLRQQACLNCNAQPGEPCTQPTDTGRRPVSFYHFARSTS